MEIFDIIKGLCDEKNVKISVLERDLSFSRGSIYKMADSAPSADKIRKLADYFNVSADYLLGRTNTKSGCSFNDTPEITLDMFFKFFESKKNVLTPEEKLTLVKLITSNNN